MFKLPKNHNITRIISHKNCADGIASALILRAALPEARVEFYSYDSPELRGLDADDGTAIFCDISPTKDRAQEFADKGHFCLDHHKSAKEIVELFDERGRFADEKDEPGISGAMLAFEVYASEPAPTSETAWERTEEFAQLAGIYDTWQRQDKRWDEASKQASYLHFLGEEEAMGRPRTQSYLSVDEVEFARLLRKRHLQNATDAYERRLTYMGGYGIFADNQDGRLINEVADIARERQDTCLAIVGYTILPAKGDTDMKFKFSLRRVRSDYDCAKMAEKHGGGGHSGAAAFNAEVCRIGPSPLRWLFDEFLDS